jgi:hypothetical protein
MPCRGAIAFAAALGLGADSTARFAAAKSASGQSGLIMLSVRFSGFDPKPTAVDDQTSQADNLVN